MLQRSDVPDNCLYVPKLLNSLYEAKLSISTVAKHTMYAQLPFRGSSTTTIRSEVFEVLGKFYPEIKHNFSFRTSFATGSFFKKHYPTDMLVRSSVFCKDICDYYWQFYIGSTALQLFRRCAQHNWESLRKGDRLTSPHNNHCSTFRP